MQDITTITTGEDMTVTIAVVFPSRKVVLINFSF